MTAETDGKAARVAVLGAGIMGSAMVRNLAGAVLATRVWDRSASATAPLADAGDGHHRRSSDPGHEGPAGVEPARRHVRGRPGIGSKGPAERGELLILASGPAGAAGPLRPVFGALGRKTVWLGEAGQGSQMKLVVNTYLSILVGGVAETMELADRLGIAHQQLAEVIEGGPLDAPLAMAKFRKMDQRDFAAEFPLEWALKHVDLAITAAHDDTLPLLAALSGQWHAAVDAGHGRQDISAGRLALGGSAPGSR